MLPGGVGKCRPDWIVRYSATQRANAVAEFERLADVSAVVRCCPSRITEGDMIVMYLIATLIAGGIYTLLRQRRTAVRLGIAVAAFVLLSSGATFLMYVGDSCPGCVTVRAHRP